MMVWSASVSSFLDWWLNESVLWTVKRLFVWPTSPPPTAICLLCNGPQERNACSIIHNRSVNYTSRQSPIVGCHSTMAISTIIKFSSETFFTCASETKNDYRGVWRHAPRDELKALKCVFFFADGEKLPSWMESWKLPSTDCYLNRLLQLWNDVMQFKLQTLSF